MCPPSLVLGSMRLTAASIISSGLRIKTLAEFFRPQPARISGVMLIHLLLGLHSGRLHLLGVDHDHVIAGIDKRRVTRILFTHEDAGDLRSQPAERLPEASTTYHLRTISPALGK